MSRPVIDPRWEEPAFQDLIEHLTGKGWLDPKTRRELLVFFQWRLEHETRLNPRQMAMVGLFLKEKLHEMELEES